MKNVGRRLQAILLPSSAPMSARSARNARWQCTIHVLIAGANSFADRDRKARQPAIERFADHANTSQLQVTRWPQPASALPYFAFTGAETWTVPH